MPDLPSRSCDIWFIPRRVVDAAKCLLQRRLDRRAIATIHHDDNATIGRTVGADAGNSLVATHNQRPADSSAPSNKTGSATRNCASASDHPFHNR
jgi:hypothetical protein